MHQFEHKRIDVSIQWDKPISIEDVKQLQQEKCKNTYFIKLWAGTTIIINFFT